MTIKSDESPYCSNNIVCRHNYAEENVISAGNVRKYTIKHNVDYMDVKNIL
ncbi:Hypothetical protein PEIBARAKI_5328 [Petrimonas sp. IBARAKI]|nr:Hypothetical protein PEIBARAKI_5328 [Petrimonas sp. IBARAKI]